MSREPTGPHTDRQLVEFMRTVRERAHDPYMCPRAAQGCGHHVEDRNPMATGRCTNCRAFVAYSARCGSWRRCTRAYAASRALLGTRRNLVIDVYDEREARRWQDRGGSALAG